MLDESTITELAGICDTLETDHDLRVLVLSAVNPDYFMARYDLPATPTDPADPFAGLRAFAQATARLSQVLACPPTISTCMGGLRVAAGTAVLRRGLSRSRPR